MAPTSRVAFLVVCSLQLSNSLLALPSRTTPATGGRDQRRPGAEVTSAGKEAGLRADTQASLRANVGDGLRNGLASGLASATCKTLLHPFDVVKTVEQASKAKIGMVKAMRQVARESGSTALFTRGLDVTLIGSVPSIAVYFGAYQFFKKTLSVAMGPQWRHAAVALSAALANSIAAFFRVPAEIVKQRVQAGLHRNAAAAVRDIYREGGLGAFLELRSVLAQMMRDIPYAVVMLVVYEGLKTAVIEREHACYHTATVLPDAGGKQAAGWRFMRRRLKRAETSTESTRASGSGGEAKCESDAQRGGVRKRMVESSAMQGLQASLWRPRPLRGLLREDVCLLCVCLCVCVCVCVCSL